MVSDNLLDSPKGMRDFLPDEKLRRDELVSILRREFELHGFDPLETPALETYEILSSKYAGGEEILKEVFKSSDQGGRKLGLRYDLTVPMARVVAAHPNLRFPFKRYQIQPVWRDGPLKPGRFREFIQCDVDIVGVASMLADAEVLSMGVAVLESLFPANYRIEVNNRKLLNGLLDAAGVPNEKEVGAILSLDKLKKIGAKGVKEELAAKGIPAKAADKLLSFFDGLDGANDENLASLSKHMKSEEGKQGISELSGLFLHADSMGFSGGIKFTPSLARGLAYYTSTVFEGFLEKNRITSSLFGGGRYDNLIGDFAARSEKIPAVGISFGLDTILEALGDSLPSRKTVSKALVAAIKKEQLPYASKVVSQLRRAGVNSSLDLAGRQLSKNLEYASKQGIPFVAIVGEKEEKASKVTLRNMASGEEKLVSVEEASKLMA